ncbi:hypothetical protein Anapl_05875 [Anas platyrhynchos]|uniref:Uncharacterized protein n=1 Tax=Anas platyrhynchos TaxID=8839 RepID=R0M7D3_ANAPL|nr:hypothetical protein Anapl_05875 [Anas platyrhynchos]
MIQVLQIVKDLVSPARRRTDTAKKGTQETDTENTWADTCREHWACGGEEECRKSVSLSRSLTDVGETFQSRMATAEHNWQHHLDVRIENRHCIEICSADTTTKLKSPNYKACKVQCKR